ncbi:MAG: histidine phosphatase family protein [Patescibacteria group bacterium]|jgi:broad specificity phosphatase PhoE
MKWPSKIILVRHGQSGYNILREKKLADPAYRRFVAGFDKNPTGLITRYRAWRIWHKYSLGYGDCDTPLTEAGAAQPVVVGQALSTEIELPETIFVSPYDRTHQTLAGLIEGWPELGGVRVVEEPRLREQEHGLALVYNDWRVFHALNPSQRILFGLEGPYWYRYPQGENIPDVIERMRSLVGTMVRDYSEKRILFVTHHVGILAFFATIFRWSDKEFIEWDNNRKPINCGVTIFRGNPDVGRDGKLELVEYNKKLY